ncbi:hypothetical protein BXZ70DRAFT_1009086 [Cristinia sonorae]|uniref:Uncharacterized protein n=1 Tax=Cristinia sonorae TaxID=1940300 RepID=A0A8K0UM64_9AGAR|nr:hypothetical protein BXZ70DRAFT_1009086 [Cristinia sonorae]
MSSTTQPKSSSSWWSRSKSTKDLPPLHTVPSAPEKSSIHSNATSAKSSASSKFNSFVTTAIGKKPKKHAIAIQDPPPSISVRPSPAPTLSGRSTAEHSPLTSPHSIRPPNLDYSRSLRHYDVDQSSDFQSEPRTPSDHPRDRSSYQHSLLTMSDPDPFASGAMLFSPFAPDFNRSSVYSDNSLLDPNSSKRPDPAYFNRISYGSSSSNSHSNPSEGHGARSTLSSSGRSQISRRPSEASSRLPERHRRQTSTGIESAVVASAFARNRADMHPGSSSSHSTITDRHMRSTPSGAPGHPGSPRPSPSVLRARGMTVGSTMRPSTASGILGQSTSGGSVMSPEPLRRKASETFSTGRTSDRSFATSASPITFSRTRTSSTDTNSTTFPTTTATPVVLVRKASSSRLLVPSLDVAPPSTNLPPTPPSPSGLSSFLGTIDDFHAELNFTEPISSSASTLSFASQIDLTDIGDDMMHHLIRDSFIDQDIPASYADISPPSTLRGLNSRNNGSSSSMSKTFGPSVPATPTKTLKKAMSQSSLLGKRYSANSVASSILSNEDPSPIPLKGPKKQRSFHHTRIPLPPLPSLRYASSQTNTTSSIPNDSPTSSSFSPTDSKRPPTSPPHTRKRLFSGSSMRRNSQSQQNSPISPTQDDDLRSLASIDSSNDRRAKSAKPIMMSFATFGNHVSLVTENACISPSWDDPPPPPPKRRESQQSEYVPQYIMSPEALLKLEEELAAEAERKNKQNALNAPSSSGTKFQLEPEDFGLQSSIRRPSSTRSRTHSGASAASTSLAHFSREDSSSSGDGAIGGLSPRSRVASTKSGKKGLSELEPSRIGSRSNSVMAHTVTRPPLGQRRPSTAQPRLSPPSSPSTIRHSSPERPSTALSPPPRARQPSRDQFLPGSSSNTTSPFNKRASIMPINPLSPPPRRKNSQASTMVFSEAREPPREPPRLGPTRPPSSFDPQRILARRSIMKKPSFLEIDDDAEHDTDGTEKLVSASSKPLADSAIMESSFLDLERGSFDSFRSEDDGVVF